MTEGKINHVCPLINGLKYLANRDIVRENDGEAMVDTWKVDIPHFWQRRHNKYIIICYNSISSISLLTHVLN